MGIKSGEAKYLSKNAKSLANHLHPCQFIHVVYRANRWTINLIPISTPLEIDFVLAFNFTIIN